MTTAATPKSTAITPYQQKVATVRDLFEKSKGQIRMALPKHVNADRLLRVVLTSVQKTPTLLDCDRVSLLGAVMQAAQLGLEVDNGLGHAYLVPYGKTATLILGYRGMIDLARRSGQLSTIYAEVVHEKDAFDYEMGLRPRLTHKPSDEDDPGAFTHVYAVAKLRDGGEQFVVMSKRQVEAIRTRSKASANGPWKTDTEEMIKKTAIRRLFKVLPVSIEMATAAALNDAADIGAPQTFDIGVDLGGEKIVDAEVAEVKPSLDDLATQAAKAELEMSGE
jgi:recombination protein RecT